MALRSSRTLDAAAAADHIGRWMTDYIDRSGLDGWVVGVSGGIDSAVTSTLAARTGRPTTVLRMPIHQAADQDRRGADHIAWLESEFDNVSSLVVDLTPSFAGLFGALAGASGAPFGGLSLANERAVWSELRNEEVLYTRRRMDIQRWTADAPFTKAGAVPQDSPDRLGWFIGMRWVEDLMARRTDLDLPGLMAQEDVLPFLQAYRPGS